MKIMVTGANGLVGRALCSAVHQTEHQVVQTVRTPLTPSEFAVGDLNASTDWDKALNTGVDVVVHLAAKVPLTDGAIRGQDDQYAQINTLGTANLARQCAEHGVKRFIFVSTVKVLGNGKDEPYRDDDLAVPADIYAISKWEAEQSLWQIAAETSMEIVILRPPLVYGPGVKGNFLRLMQATDKRWPLPFGAIQNRRSLICLGNLVDVILLCLTHPQAAGKTFLVSDGDDVSTPELVRRIAAALRRHPFLVPVPTSCMRWAGRMLGKEAAVGRLLESLAVDTALVRTELGWRPPYSIQTGLEATAQWYRKTKESA